MASRDAQKELVDDALFDARWMQSQRSICNLASRVVREPHADGQRWHTHNAFLSSHTAA